MKLVIVATLALLACAAAAPAAAPADVAVVANVRAVAPVAPIAPVAPVVQILKSESSHEPNGEYTYAFETDDGTKKQEVGELKTLTNEKNEPVEVVVVKGSYAYTDPEGNNYIVTYYADETGFHSDNEPKA